MPSTLDPARRAALVGAKLTTLVTDAGRSPTGTPTGLGLGAVVVDDTGEAWALLQEPMGRGLGGALAWALRHDCDRLRVIAESGTGAMSRRAAQLSFPVAVQHLEGRTLIDAIAEPLPPPVGVAHGHRAFVELIAAAGAVAVEEHGVLSGEVNGLEVCRVVDDPVSGSPRLEVGIGAHDREMFQMLHGHRSPVESLADVVRSVQVHRQPDSLRHPLNHLAASRLLRARVVADPSLIGLSALVAGEPPIARGNLKDEVPCVAFDDSSGTVVVFVSGVDLEVVPFACDAIERRAASACTIAAPPRDIIPIQQRLALLVSTPTRFMPVPAAVPAPVPAS